MQSFYFVSDLIIIIIRIINDIKYATKLFINCEKRNMERESTLHAIN